MVSSSRGRKVQRRYDPATDRLKWHMGRDMVQADSHRSVTAKIQIWKQDNPCEICDGRSGTWTGFPPSTYAFPVNLIPPMFHTHLHLQVYLIKRKNGWSLGNFRLAMLFRKSQRIEHKSNSSVLNDNQVVPHPLSKASIRLKMKATQLPPVNNDNYKLRSWRYWMHFVDRCLPNGRVG